MFFAIGFVSIGVIVVLKMNVSYLGYVAIKITVLSFNAHWLFSRNYLRRLVEERDRNDK